MLLFWVSLVWLLQLGLCFIIVLGCVWWAEQAYCASEVSSFLSPLYLCLEGVFFCDLLISVCFGCSSDYLVPRWLLVKQYKEVGVLSLPLKASLEEALVSGVGLFFLWILVLDVLVLAWYREPWVQSMFVLVLLCWPLHRLLSLVIHWFLARVSAVLGLVDLLLFSFSRIVYRFRCMSVRFI